MIGYGVENSWENPPEIAFGNYTIWRLLIDRNYQHMGYGRRAMELAIEIVKTMPCGPAEKCFVSYEPENAVAKKLYNSLGFIENGDMDGEEIIAVLPL